MKFLFAVSVILGIVAQICQVQAVVCNDLSKCQKTDFTTTVCVSNKCQCTTGYFPVGEGCVEKPKKPKVALNSVNNDEAIEGENVVLTCESDAASGNTYKWFVDDTEDTTRTDEEATFTMGTKDTNYACSVTRRRLESDKSDVQTIRHLATTSGPSSAKPKLSLSSPDGVAVGRDFEVTCTGYPYGFVAGDAKITDKDGNDVTAPVRQAADVETTHTFTCNFERDSFTFPGGETTIQYPALIDSISTVKITSSSPATAFTTVQPPTLTCEISPAVDALPDSADISYVWSEGGSQDKEWRVPGTKADYNDLTCTATLQGKAAVKSKAFPKFTVNDNYLKKPTITANPPKPVAASQISLTCETEEKDVQISWQQATSSIIGQSDKTIQYGSIAASLNGPFTCSISKDGFVATSDSFALNVETEIETPVISGSTGEVGKWGEMNLKCDSESAVPAMTYQWKKDGKDIEKATDATYKVEEFESKNAGKYTCTTKFSTLDAKTSAEVEVKLVDPGVACKEDKECDKSKKSLTGKCDTKTKRCVCASKYYAKGNECDNGVAQMGASLVVVLVAALVSRLM